MRVKVSNKIIISDYPQSLLEWCEQNLVLANPEFQKKERMGLWVGSTPRNIALYEKNGGDLILPFGCLNKIWSEHKGKCQFERQIRSLRTIKYDSSIKLYDYQSEAVNKALWAKNGVLVMPCGAGKTQTALEIISEIGGKTLWLTHTTELLNQSMNRAKSVLNIDSKSYGTVTGGKINIGSGITFATVQTMAKIDLPAVKDCWDVVVVDECHRAIGSPTKVMQFYKVLSNLSCRYKFGLTATPKRADGLEKCMYALIGEKIIEIDKERVRNTTCDVEVHFIDTEYMPNPDKILMGDGTINYNSLTNELVNDQQRFDLVLKTLINLPVNQPALILGNRVEYLTRLCDAYNQSQAGTGICLSGNGISKTSKEKRKRALEALNNCEIDCVFATYALAKEGLDVPNLRYVIFATPEKDETTVTQSAGRVARKYDGKDKGIILDFVDRFGLYQGYKKKRARYYSRLGYNILS